MRWSIYGNAGGMCEKFGFIRKRNCLDCAVCHLTDGYRIAKSMPMCVFFSLLSFYRFGEPWCIQTPHATELPTRKTGSVILCRRRVYICTTIGAHSTRHCERTQKWLDACEGLESRTVFCASVRFWQFILFARTLSPILSLPLWPSPALCSPDSISFLRWVVFFVIYWRFVEIFSKRLNQLTCIE